MLDAHGNVLWESGGTNGEGVITDTAGNPLLTEFFSPSQQTLIALGGCAGAGELLVIGFSGDGAGDDLNFPKRGLRRRSKWDATSEEKGD